MNTPKTKLAFTLLTREQRRAIQNDILKKHPESRTELEWDFLAYDLHSKETV